MKQCQMMERNETKIQCSKMLKQNKRIIKLLMVDIYLTFQ